MSSTAIQQLDKIQIDNREFYETDFMGIQVIRTNDGFYNATKICQDNGYTDFRQITRLPEWQRFVNDFKSVMKINRATGDLHFVLGETNNKNSPADLQMSVSSLDNEEKWSDIVDDDLMFEVKTRANEYKWAAGTYIRGDLVDKLLTKCNNIYAIQIGHYIRLVNEELHLRNITLETKIKEQEEELQIIRDLHDRSQRGHNSEVPGCIILRRINGYDNLYRISADTKERDDNWNWTYCFNGVYNPERTCSHLKWYIKSCVWDDVLYVSYATHSYSGAVINDIEAFRKHIEDAQLFKNINQPSTEILVGLYKSKAKSSSYNLKAKLFEVYCSEKYKIKLAPYEIGERISLFKKDNGLDLLSINDKRMGQCKYYTGSKPLNLGNLTQFLQFCRNYPSWAHELYISSEMEITSPIRDNKDITIIEVDDEEFNKWYESYTSDIDKQDVPEIIQSIVKCNKEQYKEAEEWLKNELAIHDYIYLDDVYPSIGQRFDIPIQGLNKFGAMFSHLYHRDRSSNRLPRDNNNRSILVSIDKEVPKLTSNTSKVPRELIIDIIGTKSMLMKDVLEEIYKRTGQKITFDNYLMRNFKDMFVLVNGKTKVRYMNGHQTRVFELNMDTYPEGYLEIYNFIKEEQPNIDKKELVAKINERFHRLESFKSIDSFIHDLKERFEESNL